jgi:hypothetical protein
MHSRNVLLLIAILSLTVPILSPAAAQTSLAQSQSQPVELDSAGNVIGEGAPTPQAPSTIESPSQTSILCYTTRTGTPDPCERIATIFTNVVTITSLANFPNDLSPYDVVYIGYGEGNAVDSLAGQLEPYVNGGGGLIVSQPNLEGTIDVYPPGFEMEVTSQYWPEFPSAPGPVEFTAAGAGHGILNGLTPADLSGNFETVPLSTLGPGWVVLAKAAAYPNVALAAGRYGDGRLVFHSGNVSTAAIDPGSDTYVHQMIEWAGAESTPGPDMRIDAIEVTQAIQDLNNSVELVAGKRTYVRVHVSSPTTVNDVFANLSAQRGGLTLYPTLSPGNPGADIHVRSAPDRGQLNDSFWFELPASWIGAGDLTLTARLDPADAKNDANLTNNEMSVTVSFLSTPPLRLRQFNVRYTVGTSTYLAATSHLESLESWLRRAYPISSLQAARQTFTYPDPGLPDVDTLHGWLALGKLLRILFTGEDSRVVYYGVVDDGGGFMRGKAAGIPGTIAAGPAGSSNWGWDFDGSYNDWYGGHEIAHTRGRYHAEFCGAGGGTAYPHTSGRISPTTSGATAIYGFDIVNRTVYAPTWKDVMTYCSNQWISDFTYEGIRSYLASAGDASPTGAAQAEDWLAVMGIAYLADNTGQLESVYLLAEPNQIAPPEPGDWTIALVDAGGADLATHPFSPDELTDAEESPRRPAVISEIVPWVEGAVRVEIRYGGQVIDARDRSANPPTVEVTSPAPGAQIQQATPLVVDWTASDPDGDPLTFSILFSDTGGETWETLATGLSGESFEIDPDLLPGGQSSQVRVVASDGFNGASADSGVFFVPTHPPQVEILSPMEGGVFYPGQLVVLEGSAFDLEDGQLIGDRLEWSSSLDGPLGTGTYTDTVGLSTGQHVITLLATDYDAEQSQAQRTITVLAGDEPEPDLLEVAPTALGVLAAEGDPASNHELTVRNAGEGPLSWTATEDTGWLQLSSASGDTPSDLTLTVDPAGLAPGEHEAEIIVTSADATNSPVSVPVVLTVVGAPAYNVYLPLMLKDVP